MKKVLGLAACLILAVLCGRGDAQELAPFPLQATSSLSASLVVGGAGARTLVGFSAANNNAAARWVLIYDATAAPGDGTTTPIDFYLLAGVGSPPSNAIRVNYNIPARTLVGLVFVCSSTGPFTKTAATDCAFSVQAQ